MTLAPVWRTRLFALGGSLLAIWCGSAIAAQELAGPGLIAATLLGFMLAVVQPRPFGAVLLGAVAFGYVVGNRGFAQISLSDRFPLLPAELVLLATCSVLAVRSALRRELPLRRDALNLAVLAWFVIGLARMLFDVRAHGFAALRDFALVYYAAFFLLAQHEARAETAARLLHRWLAWSCVVLLVVHTIYGWFPEFFLTRLTLRGIPVIFYKGDLAGTFMAMGAVMWFLAFERERRGWRLVLSLALTAGTLGSNNRASMLGLAAAAVLLALGGRWRFLATQIAAGAGAAVVVLAVAQARDQPWKQTPVYSAYERAASLFDPLGERAYSGEETAFKGDNNRFRAAWWRAVFYETLDGNPWLGLGFGHDLAARFVREYYPDAGDEFSARSPHNVLLTIFGRMGVVGLVPFLVMVVVILRGAWRAARAGPTRQTAGWCAACVVLVSACFGVVLEGPMGAVVFWTALGMANGAFDSQLASADTSDRTLASSQREPTVLPS